ncbi:hypothetical protein C4577_02925 [Candidatus Parcubacteria bacterium]|nr:MAG: hypothetical protein C4577_02925 [Candidatus Parcubacteria bacterium]
MRVEFKWVLDRNGVETPLNIVGEYFPESYGSLMEPPEPSDIEIESVKDKDGNEVGLTEEEMLLCVEESLAEIETGYEDAGIEDEDEREYF